MSDPGHVLREIARDRIRRNAFRRDQITTAPVPVPGCPTSGPLAFRPDSRPNTAAMSFTLVYIGLSIGIPVLTFAACVLGQKMGSH